MPVFPFFPKLCVCLTEAAGAETHSRAIADMSSPEESLVLHCPIFSHYTICVSLHYAFYLSLFAHSCEHAVFSEGEVKERRLLMQLITELTATVSCLVCSKSSGTPLGKMRGLITVKLANEQVNYRTKFLYKKCHFSERCSSSCSKSLKKKGEEGRWMRRKSGGQMPFSPFLFQENSLVSAPLSSEACRLRLRGNGCINELFFFFQRTLFPLAFTPPPPPPLPSPTQETASNPLTPAFYPLSRSLAFILHLTGAFGRLQIFYLLQPRRKGISETSPKVGKDVPFHTQKECGASSLGKTAKVIRENR